MNNEGSEPKVNPEEESVINRPRPKLEMAPLKNKPRETNEKPVESFVKDEELSRKEEKKLEQKKREEELQNKKEAQEEKRRKRLEKKLEKKLDDPPLITFKDTAKHIISDGKLPVFFLASALIMIFISIFLYHVVFSFISGLTAPFYSIPPLVEEWYHHFRLLGWSVLKFFFNMSTTVFIFYVTFLIAYVLCSPLYSFISFVSENIFEGKPEEDNEFSFDFVHEDILQSLKLAGLSAGVILYLFFVNFVPVIGQILVFFLYPVLNTFLLIDFFAARKGWTFMSRFMWLKKNWFMVFVMGGIVMFITLIPLANNILAAFAFPFFVVYSSINMAVIEKHKNRQKKDIESE